MPNTKQQYTCKVCGYTWFPRSEQKPRQCANRSCGSNNWETGVGKRESMKIQRRNAAKRRAILSNAEAGNIVIRKPVTSEVRRAGMELLGGFLQPSGETISVGTVNAGPWRNITRDEPEEVGLTELLDWDKNDLLWRVSESEGDGLCLTGDDIWPGDFIQFTSDKAPEAGDIVVCVGHDEAGEFFATAKHYHPLPDGRIELRSSNPKCPPISAYAFNVEILGVAVDVFRRGLHRKKRNGVRRK